MNKELIDGKYGYLEQNPKYMGQPFDSELAYGPCEDRKCRDFLFCILFIAFWVGLIIIAIFGFSRGQPHLLAAPFSSSGQQCGYTLGYQNYPYVYFNTHNYSQFACINECPGPSGPTNTTQCINNNITFNCTLYGSYGTQKVVSVCYPTNNEIAQFISLGIGFFNASISDLSITWPISLSVIFISLILSVLLMMFIRVCGGCVIISSIFLYFVLLVIFGLLSFLTAEHVIEIPGLDQIRDPDLLYAIAYISWIIAGISLLVLLCSFHKIRVAIAIIKTTAEFTRQQCQTILVPFVMFLAITVFFVLWIIVSVFIFSSGTIQQCQGSPYACINWDVGVKRCLIYYFIGLFWNCEVAIGMCQFVIASTTAYWYFSHLNGKQTSNPVCRSFCRALFYHLGSIALGALILCILFILQLIFQILHHFGKQHTLSQDPVVNGCARCCISCTRCCLACFQRFIRFISKNAFILMAITGESFCTSSHQAFYLIIRSAGQYAITHGAGHLIMFFGKLLITIGTTLIGYVMITEIEYFSQSLFSPFMPTVVSITLIKIFVVISFVISSLFMDVFGIGSDTLLMCYCLELDILKDVKSCPGALKDVLDGFR